MDAEVEKAADNGRWDFATAVAAVRTPDRLGEHIAARYGHSRRYIENLFDLDLSLRGLLLSAKIMCDELRSYEEQTSTLVRLAQTGHYVRQLQRLIVSGQFSLRRARA
jgi:hypothetical protein